MCLRSLKGHYRNPIDLNSVKCRHFENHFKETKADKNVTGKNESTRIQYLLLLGREKRFAYVCKEKFFLHAGLQRRQSQQQTKRTIQCMR